MRVVMEVAGAPHIVVLLQSRCHRCHLLILEGAARLRTKKCVFGGRTGGMSSYLIHTGTRGGYGGAVGDSGLDGKDEDFGAVAGRAGGEGDMEGTWLQQAVMGQRWLAES